MDTSLKRIIAYIIDIAVVTIFVTLVAKLPINPYLSEYNENYNAYNKLIEDYKNNEVSEDIYKEKLIEYNYELGKTNVINGSITIVSLVLYFGVVQLLLGGQTLGKRILKLKLVSKDENKKLHFGNYLLRTVVLNNILFRVLILVGVFFLGKTTYYHFSSTLTFIESIVESVILVMVVLKSDNRGLHDMIASTKVIDINAPVTEEVKVIETKEVKKSNKRNTKK